MSEPDELFTNKIAPYVVLAVTGLGLLGVGLVFQRQEANQPPVASAPSSVVYDHRTWIVDPVAGPVRMEAREVAAVAKSGSVVVYARKPSVGGPGGGGGGETRPARLYVRIGPDLYRVLVPAPRIPAEDAWPYRMPGLYY